MEDSITVERRDREAHLSIDRPPLNILDLTTIRSLRRHLATLADDLSLQVLVVSGAGERAFSAGVAVEDHTPDRVEAMLESFHGALLALMGLPAVVIAAVRGHCLGGGMELAAACDLVVATDDSRFGQPEIKLGCFPPFAAALYPSLFGSQRTADLLLTGRTIDARVATEIGLVARVESRDGFDSAVAELVGEVTAHSAAATRLTKRAIQTSRVRAFEAALADSERIYNHDLVATEDMQEGLSAFLEKRAPRWRHR